MRDDPFVCPPENGGQAVVREYWAVGDKVVRVTHDRSDGTLLFHTSRRLKNDGAEYWNGAPKNKRWRAVSKDEINELLCDWGYEIKF